MKYILLCLLTLFPMSAFALDCTSSKAITQAKLAMADGSVDPNSFQLEHVVEGTIGAMPVCQALVEKDGQSMMATWTNNDDGSITLFQQDGQGNLTTTNLAPNGAENELQQLQNLQAAQQKQYDQGQSNSGN